MTHLRAIVVDDEEPARELLRSMLRSWPRIEIIGEASDGASALSLFHALSPDLLFLDVQMPGLTGFDVVAALSAETAPLVVFVTAFDRYALKAFEVSACDYLLKPFDEARLATAVQRALDRYDRHDRTDAAAGADLRALLDEVRGPSQVVVKSDGKHIFLDAGEIDWVEADGKELKVHVGKSVLRVRETLSHFEHRLPSHRFLRVHRSIVVNRSRVREMQPRYQGEYLLILRDGTRVITGPSYRDVILGLTRQG